MKFAWWCSHESLQPEVLVDQAVLAEEVGFDVVLGSDHFHPWVHHESAAGFVWSWFGAVAARTDLEMATSVSCPLYGSPCRRGHVMTLGGRSIRCAACERRAAWKRLIRWCCA